MKLSRRGFLGTLLGALVAPYIPRPPTKEIIEPIVTAYKGVTAFDAGVFYCPYIPLQMVKAVDNDQCKSQIEFKTRYGMAVNPFKETL